MDIEKAIKELMLEKYGSVRAFSIAVGIPYSTIDNMLKRGVGGTGVSTMIAVCRALDIDVNMLQDGIFPRGTWIEREIGEITSDEFNLIMTFRNLNSEGQGKAIDYVYDLAGNSKYKKGKAAGKDEKTFPAMEIAAELMDHTQQIFRTNKPDK